MKQILCDVEYLVNVFGAMEMEPVDRLKWLSELLPLQGDELIKLECQGGKEVLKSRLVAMRIKKE